MYIIIIIIIIIVQRHDSQEHNPQRTKASLSH